MAVLRSDRFDDLSVCLLNESATGFLVEADSSAPVQSEDVVKLRTHQGWCEVKIVHKEPKDADDGRTLLGIQRIRDLRDDDEESADDDRPSWKRLFFRLLALLRRPNVCIPLTVLCLAILWYATSRVRSSAGPPMPSHAEEIFADDPLASQLLAEEQKRELLDAKTGALIDLVSSPEVAEELELTEGQQQKVHKIVASSEQSLAGESLSLEQREAIVAQASVEVLGALSPKQKKKFLRHRSQNRPVARLGGGTDRYVGSSASDTPPNRSGHWLDPQANPSSSTESATSGSSASTGDPIIGRASRVEDRPPLEPDPAWDQTPRGTPPSDSGGHRQVLLNARIQTLNALATSSDNAARLQLSDEQQQQIRAIVQPALRSLAGGSQTLEDREQVAEKAYVEVLALLTPRQKSRLFACSTGKQLPSSLSEPADGQRTPRPSGQAEAKRTSSSKQASDERKQRLLAAKKRVLTRFVSSGKLAAKLKLTNKQRQRIRAIIRRSLSSDDGGNSSPQTESAVVEQVYAGVVAALTPAQRKQLIRLIAE